MIEEFLRNPEVQSDMWLTEQTLQALCASRLGVQFLPDSYLVTGVYRPGLTDETGRILVSKHYSGTGRVSLCEEGMRQLVRQGFLKELSVLPSGT